jgi:hypothetical protein
MHLVKRTLFNEYSQTKRLNSCTEAIKGIYSAVRLNEVSVKYFFNPVAALTVH